MLYNWCLKYSTTTTTNQNKKKNKKSNISMFPSCWIPWQEAKGHKISSILSLHFFFYPSFFISKCSLICLIPLLLLPVWSNALLFSGSQLNLYEQRCLLLHVLSADLFSYSGGLCGVVIPAAWHEWDTECNNGHSMHLLGRCLKVSAHHVRL